MMTCSRLLQAVHISEEVQQALQDGQAIVALESTIVTHGEAFKPSLDNLLLIIKTSPSAAAFLLMPCSG